MYRVKQILKRERQQQKSTSEAHWTHAITHTWNTYTFKLISFQSHHVYKYVRNQQIKKFYCSLSCTLPFTFNRFQHKTTGASSNFTCIHIQFYHKNDSSTRWIRRQWIRRQIKRSGRCTSAKQNIKKEKENVTTAAATALSVYFRVNARIYIRIMYLHWNEHTNLYWELNFSFCSFSFCCCVATITATAAAAAAAFSSLYFSFSQCSFASFHANSDAKKCPQIISKNQ